MEGMAMKRVVLILGLAAVRCGSSEPTPAEEAPSASEREVEKRVEPKAARKWKLEDLGDWNHATSMQIETTWGDPDLPAAPQTLGEKLGQGKEDGFWSWTQCSRLRVNSTQGGPGGNGYSVSTNSPARYRIWNLSPLAVEVEASSMLDVASELRFFDNEGNPFHPGRDSLLRALKVEGVKRVQCDGTINGATRRGWLWCRGLVLKTGDGETIRGTGSRSRLRVLRGGAIDWVALGDKRRGGIVTRVADVRCQRQGLLGTVE
jgi:hypothetical protein